jgi:drug/metabolite transporter (DMT)-like permease
VRARGPFLVLAVGVVAASSSSILIRHAQGLGIDSLAIAAWRLTLAAVVLLPFALARCGAEFRALSRRDCATAIVAGVVLALHFITWIRSLELTSIASSAALVATNPIWVGIATVLLYRQRLSSRTVIGIGITLVGCALILRADATLMPDALLAGRDPSAGNLLALAGAICVSGYLLLGRGLAGHLSLLAYLALVYGCAAVALMTTAVVAGVPLGGYGAVGWLLLIALAAGPQLVGHSAFNWSLRHLSPTFVALAILGEPVGSALLAALLLAEVPGVEQSVALGVLLAGIVVAASAERTTHARSSGEAGSKVGAGAVIGPGAGREAGREPGRGLRSGRGSRAGAGEVDPRRRPRWWR